jgi:hypothetical protein
MPEKENLYTEVKAILEERKDIFIAGELLSYPKRFRHLCTNERIDFYIAPSQGMDFDPDRLNTFVRSFKMQDYNSFQVGPNWTELDSSRGYTRALVLPSISFDEPLRNLSDVTNLLAALEYFQREEEIPDFNPFWSEREISLQIYPNERYASQILEYRQQLALTKNENEQLDFLYQYITPEQIEAAIKMGSSLNLKRLPKSPEQTEREKVGN